jgi:uncharacterized repeat protein (TIGR03803 family)
MEQETIASEDAAFALARRTRGIGITLAVFAVSMLITRAMYAQTFSVIHNFTGGLDGNGPTARLTISRGGFFYGTTALGGAFELKNDGSGWILVPLASLGSSWAGVTIGPNGTLYGTTQLGGTGQCQNGCGTIYNLRPGATSCETALCLWSVNVIHELAGPPGDGSYPLSDVIFDSLGNLYGTAQEGGASNDGIIFELSPSGGGWTKSTLHTFVGGDGDGEIPLSGLIFDNSGNLYGTTNMGGPADVGTVYELSPSGSGWTINILNAFGGTGGEYPSAGLVLDHLGNMYGAAAGGGTQGSGTVFKFTPTDGGWTFTTIYNFGESGCAGGYAGP